MLINAMPISRMTFIEPLSPVCGFGRGSGISPSGTSVAGTLSGGSHVGGSAGQVAGGVVGGHG